MVDDKGLLCIQDETLHPDFTDAANIPARIRFVAVPAFNGDKPLKSGEKRVVLVVNSSDVALGQRDRFHGCPPPVASGASKSSPGSIPSVWQTDMSASEVGFRRPDSQLRIVCSGTADFAASSNTVRCARVRAPERLFGLKACECLLITRALCTRTVRKSTLLHEIRAEYT